MISKILLERIVPMVLVLAMLSLAMPASVSAQFGAFPQQPAANARTVAPLDLTGYWVSVVTEDWRYRMMTPEKGDFAGIFPTSEGQRIANSWDPDKDEANGDQCKSYGAAAIMRVPTRLHITWENDNTLRVETDAGKQTRIFHFGAAAAPPGEPPTLQGYSVATWEGLRPFGFAMPITAGAAAPPQEGYLKVMTSGLKPGYLRKNGVPYGASAMVEEYFDGFREPNGDTWLIVTTIVTDPHYLAQPFITSSQFKKESDASKWNPTPCEAK
jgi:hypothetical protein